MHKFNIVIGISGGIAAYKILYLIRLFKKSGHNVRIVITENAYNFIGKASIETLSENRIIHNLFENENMEHIDLASWGDIFLIAPATANIIGKCANGIADDALSTTFLSFGKDIVMCPAMNNRMYNNRIVQENIKKLLNAGINILGPVNGSLACGTEDIGRMIEPEQIYHYTMRILYKDNFWNSKRVILTGGGTQEYIDPVRYIGNASSGKLSMHLLKWLYYYGAEIKFIKGHTSVLFPALYGVDIVETVSVDDMYKEVKKTKGDILIMAAAVSDFTITKNKTKIKKDRLPDLKLEYARDILESIKNKKIYKVGFALENILDNELIMAKMKKKKMDIIVANKTDNIGSDEGFLKIYSKQGKTAQIKGNKEEQAKYILSFVKKYYG